MSPPAVSVVLIFFDDERFLDEAIRSVENQSFADWELILVDDGSSDGSTALARSHAARVPERIRYVDHPGHANHGPSAARNLGIRVAEGRFIAFLDSDDVWLPNKLEEQVAILEAHPDVGLLCGASLYWWSWAGPDAPRSDELMRVGAAEDTVHEPPRLLHQLYPLAPEMGVAPCPSSWIVRREAVEGFDGFEEQFRTMYEDQAFLLKAYLHTPVYVSSRCWDRYRRHPGAATLTVNRSRYLAARHEVLEWFGWYLDMIGYDDPGVQRLLHRALWPARHPRLATIRELGGRAGRLLARVADRKGCD